MKGLELSKLYFETYGRPMLEEGFSAYLDRIAVGLVGHGSQCFGYDDGISRDHDFEPGFCIWLTEEDERDFGFKLFRAYSKLPKEFMGVKVENKSLFGSDTFGVHTIKDFYSFYLPNGEPPRTIDDWLRIPDFYLAEATNGEVFSDPLGEFTRIREILLSGMPRDVRLAKIASSVLLMAQSGQYNYSRCLSHGEKISSAVALTQFAENTAKTVFLLNSKHMPYYKWAFRAMRGLPILGSLADDLETLLECPYDREKNIPIVEKIASQVADELRFRDLSDRTEDYLEPYAYCIHNRIADPSLRNSPVIL